MSIYGLFGPDNNMQTLRGFFKRMFGRWEDRPQEQNFYVKMVFAVFSAVVCAAAGRTFAGLRGILFGILVYILTLYVIVYILEIDPKDLGGRTKLVTNSLFSYILLWVLLWSIMYSFIITAP